MTEATKITNTKEEMNKAQPGRLKGPQLCGKSKRPTNANQSFAKRGNEVEWESWLAPGAWQKNTPLGNFKKGKILDGSSFFQGEMPKT